MKFTKQNLPLIREAIQAKLNEVAEEFDLESIELGNISFSQNSFTSKVTANAVAQIDDPMVKSFLENNGLPLDLIGKELTINRKWFKVTKIDFKKIKYPILADGAQGGGYKLSIDQVKSGL